MDINDLDKLSREEIALIAQRCIEILSGYGKPVIERNPLLKDNAAYQAFMDAEYPDSI